MWISARLGRLAVVNVGRSFCSIILTTVTDVVGRFAFLGLATILADMLAGS